MHHVHLRREQTQVGGAAAVRRWDGPRSQAVLVSAGVVSGEGGEALFKIIEVPLLVHIR